MRVKSASLAGLWAVVSSLTLVGCAMHPPNAPATAAPARTGSSNPSPGAPGPAAPLNAAEVMVQTATAMLGQPYRFGGAAPGGFDCSGLVSFAAQSAGLRVPRTAKDQLQAGVRVGRHELEPGDLVFMRLAHKDLHVGISLGGQRFIHAPARGGRVRIDSLAATPYSAGFISARRIVASGRALGP